MNLLVTVISIVFLKCEYAYVAGICSLKWWQNGTDSIAVSAFEGFPEHVETHFEA
jgi:hypothetical protein